METQVNNMSYRDLRKEEQKQKIIRIFALMKYYNLNQTELADRLGINRANLSAIIQHRRPCGRVMDDKFLVSFPDINEDWFLRGEGEMFNSGCTSFNPVGVVVQPGNIEGEIKVLQREIEIKDKLIESLQEEVKVLRDVNRQLVQAMTKSLEQKNT